MDTMIHKTLAVFSQARFLPNLLMPCLILGIISTAQAQEPNGVNEIKVHTVDHIEGDAVSVDDNINSLANVSGPRATGKINSTNDKSQTSRSVVNTSSEVTTKLDPLIQSQAMLPSALPHNLSPWGMFVSADWVVKVVMIGLALASLLTWTALIAKTIELRGSRRSLRENLATLAASHTLAEAENINGIGQVLINAAQTELILSEELIKEKSASENIRNGVKERIVSSLMRVEVASGRQFLAGTGLLATIGAVAPFVGLFGTVWGIMNSFIGISQANTTNLAVVAPGIAEALLATALGLVAAIPAVVIYNHFARQITGIKSQLADCSAAIMRLVSRDLDKSTNIRLVPLSKQKVG